MSIIPQLFYWIQLVPGLGPLAISVKKVMKDIRMFAFAWFVFFIAFAGGINFAMRQVKNCPSNKFRTFGLLENTTGPTDGALKAVFWSLFNPGQREGRLKHGVKLNFIGFIFEHTNTHINMSFAQC